MKKLVVFLVLLISSVFLFWSCGSAPDQNADEIRVFLNGNGFNNVTKIIIVKTEPPSVTSAYFLEESSVLPHFFDYIVLAKKNNQNFLLLVLSDGKFPKIVYEIPIAGVDTITITKKNKTRPL
ncbi:hypothetical protein KKH87_01250 [Patescibacteria group bacterium]|nr:hypothetical protein [Patescibacteria group bacterium]MBU4057387.1 hypothetical protein [Patescibacteria group bacterium]MBU4116055.1 hypothetical protein [Patescibacteria group bacterium]